MGNLKQLVRPCLILITLAMAGNSIAQAPAGDLRVTGVVQITQAGTDSTMRVADTNYSWFSGDRITVQRGHAILYLNDGNSIGLLEGSDVALEVANEQIFATLDSGMLLYALEGEDRVLEVTSDEFQFEARPVESLAPCLGLTAVGLIDASQPTIDRVTVQSGRLEGQSSTGRVQRMVEPGEQVEFTSQAARLVELELPADVAEQLDGSDRTAVPCMVWWARQEAAAAAIAGAGAGFNANTIGAILYGAAGVYVGSEIISDDDEEDPTPVSP